MMMRWTLWRIGEAGRELWVWMHRNEVGNHNPRVADGASPSMWIGTARAGCAAAHESHQRTFVRPRAIAVQVETPMHPWTSCSPVPPVALQNPQRNPPPRSYPSSHSMPRGSLQACSAFLLPMNRSTIGRSIPSVRSGMNRWGRLLLPLVVLTKPKKILGVELLLVTTT